MLIVLAFAVADVVVVTSPTDAEAIDGDVVGVVAVEFLLLLIFDITLRTYLDANDGSVDGGSADEACGDGVFVDVVDKNDKSDAAGVFS